MKKKQISKSKKYAQDFWQIVVPQTKISRGLLAFSAVFTVFSLGLMFAVARWYIWQNRDVPIQLGSTFVPNYARYLGVDPKETMTAMIDDLGLDRIRLVSYWKDIEPQKGTYNFDELDWQFRLAEDRKIKVSLSIGLRQPRWPECHEPSWVNTKEPRQNWQPDLERFMTSVIERYKNSPALDSYQLENEYFLNVFGLCYNFDRQRLIEEAALVRKLDPDHKLIITRSNNWTIASGFPVGQPRADEFGVSVYKRVWDRTITKRYYEYPIPPWFYSVLAGGGKILTGKDLIIHELQTEAWTPDGFEIKNAPIDELYNSMNPKRLKERIKYAKDSGMRTIDTWGAEWWYQMKTQRDAPELWETAKQELLDLKSQ